MTGRLAAVALLAASCGGSSPARTGAPAVKIRSPQPGTVIKGNVVTLDLAATGVSIVKANGDTSGVSGHFHVFVDRDPVPVGEIIPKEPGIIHTTENPVTITGLPVGFHHFTVVLGDGTHRRLNVPPADTTVTIDGPSIQATAPATVPRGQPVDVSVSVTGVTLVAADGDTSGKTGHLHFFVDKTPTPAGQSIPKEAGIIHTANPMLSIPDLAPGDHVIWVVLGNGAHVPLDPPVEDKVTVTVT